MNLSTLAILASAAAVAIFSFRLLIQRIKISKQTHRAKIRTQEIDYLNRELLAAITFSLDGGALNYGARRFAVAYVFPGATREEWQSIVNSNTSELVDRWEQWLLQWKTEGQKPLGSTAWSRYDKRAVHIFLELRECTGMASYERIRELRERTGIAH